MSDAVFDKLIDECMQQVRAAFSTMARGLATELKAVARQREEEPDEEEQEDEDDDDVEFHASFWARPSSEEEEEEDEDEVVLHDDDPMLRKRARDDDQPEDIEDDEDEDAHQLQELRVWLGALPKGSITDWSALYDASQGWFFRHYLVPLAMVRSALGAETRNQVLVKARWDYALSEELRGRHLRVTKMQGGAVPRQCAMCGKTKNCTFQCGEWSLGSHCAKLLRAWLKWCKALREVLERGSAAAITGYHLHRLNKALGKVLGAHENK